MSHTNLLSKRKTSRSWNPAKSFPPLTTFLAEERLVSCCPLFLPKGPWRSKKLNNEELQVRNWCGWTKVRNNEPWWNVKESSWRIERCREHRKRSKNVWNTRSRRRLQSAETIPAESQSKLHCLFPVSEEKLCSRRCSLVRSTTAWNTQPH